MERCLHFLFMITYSALAVASVLHLSALVHVVAYAVLALSHLAMVFVNLRTRRDL
jgi:hypothetical protein